MIILLACCALLAVLPGCAGAPAEDDGAIQVVATTYPVYCFATAVTEGAQGVSVSALVNQSISCLHNYTLTVRDMKLLDRADVIALSGVGLEDFMDDALATSPAERIDCSAGVDLLPSSEEEEHGESAFDPHIWMDPLRAAQMVQNLADGMCALDPDQAELYQANAESAVARLEELRDTWAEKLAGRESPQLVTFHDGFSYLADAFGMTILAAIEEDEGSTATARDLAGIADLVREYRLSTIFAEVNGSDTSAQAIARETGAEVRVLSMVMSGGGDGLTPYLDAIDGNMTEIYQAMEETAP